MLAAQATPWQPNLANVDQVGQDGVPRGGHHTSVPDWTGRVANVRGQIALGFILRAFMVSSGLLQCTHTHLQPAPRSLVSGERM